MLVLKAMAFAASGIVATWLTALAPEPTQDLYFLVARGSGKCLQQSGATLDNGDRVAQWTCANRANFKLRKVAFDDGSFALQFVHSGKCLNLAASTGELMDVLLPDTAEANGVALNQWDCGDQANGRWRAAAASDGYVFLTSEASGKCVSLKDGAKSDGEAITQWDCAKRPDMMWKLVPAR